jgi:FMN-dependent NADH-azoreductase
MKLLRVDSSARSSSVSRTLTGKFAEAWKKEHPEGEAVERDLAKTQLPLITDEWTHAAYSDQSKLTAEQKRALAVSDILIEELFAADTIVIGAPMYNFTISAPLKAWLDQVIRVGKTVARGANGPQGLLGGKKVVIITSRGGAYKAGTATAGFDYQEPYLRHVLGFLGITNVTFIHAENQKPGDLAEPARVAAVEKIKALVTQQSQPAIAH